MITNVFAFPIRDVHSFNYLGFEIATVFQQVLTLHHFVISSVLIQPHYRKLLAFVCVFFGTVSLK